MRKENEVVDVLLKESFMAPNNLQFAIAQSSIALLDKYPQQIHIIAGGQGKSRVAATIAFLSLKTDNFSKVHLVFTNNDLMTKDKTDFKNLWNLSNLNDQIVYHDDIMFQVNTGELVIFDEADEYIYGDTEAFVQFLQRHACICLTATSGGNEQEQAENSILTHIGLKLFVQS